MGRGGSTPTVLLRFVAGIVAISVLGGCTYDDREPGLFGRIVPTPSAASTPTPGADVDSSPPRRPAPLGNPDLPVAGEAVWTSGDGTAVTVRIAIHAVRRIPGATVLDWSVTPLSGPGLDTDDSVPPGFNLGLTRFGEGNTNIFLLDALRVYRPLTHRGPGLPSCLCSPVWLDQRDLWINHTTLFQLAYPALPAVTTSVDVDIASVAPFAQIPVTPIGMVPLSSRRTVLTRPPFQEDPQATTTTFDYPQGHQLFSIAVNAVYRAANFSAVSWTISAVSGGAGLENATVPPIADSAPPAKSYNRTAASGPQLTFPGSPEVLRARLSTTRLAGRGELECLCTDLRLWTVGLHDPGASVSVVTVLPPLPASATSVTLVFPGLTTIGGIRPLSSPGTAYESAGAVTRATRTWTYQADTPQPGWSSEAWPTPIPDPAQLDQFRATVDTLIR